MGTRPGPYGSIVGGGGALAAEKNGVVDLVMSQDESLHLTSEFESLHLPFAPTCCLVRILCSIVEAHILAMFDTGHRLPLRGAVARQLISDHHPRYSALALQRLVQQALGCPLVTPAPDQDIRNDARLVDGTPQPMLHLGDLGHNLVQMPFVADVGQAPTAQIGARLAELPGPRPNSLIAHDSAATFADVFVQTLDWYMACHHSNDAATVPLPAG